MNFVRQLVSDGEMPSTMRVAFFITLLFFLGSKFYNSHLTGQPIVWSAQDLGIIGSLFGAKLIQNTQENQNQSPATPAAKENP